MTLSTREPTGAANWPMLLVEGREGTRKTSESLRLSADPRIGDAYVIEVGERRVDEYASLGNFAVVEHDGHLRTIVPAIREVIAQPPREGRPNLLIIDSGTHMWDLVKRAAEAKARNSKAARKRLEDDPDAEIEVGFQAWNAVKDPWFWSWLNDLRAWPGVFVMTARADEVSKFEGGKPVLGQTDYRIDIERGAPFIFDGIVRMRGSKPALVTTAKSLNFTVPDKGLELPAELPLVHLVFDLFKAGTDIRLSVVQAKGSLVAAARGLGLDDDAAKLAAAEAWKRANGQRGEFDHHAMRALIDALELPDSTTSPPDTSGSPPEPSEGSDEAQSAGEPEGASEGLSEADDAAAFEAAPADVRAEAVEKVKNMTVPELDALLDEHGMRHVGNVQTRRARLAARLVHLSALMAAEA